MQKVKKIIVGSSIAAVEELEEVIGQGYKIVSHSVSSAFPEEPNGHRLLVIITYEELDNQ